MSISSELSRISNAKENIKTAIRGKNVTVYDSDKLGDLATRINSISSGGTNTSDATAYAGDILAGKTAYARGEKITGTLIPQSGGGGTIKFSPLFTGRYTAGQSVTLTCTFAPQMLHGYAQFASTKSRAFGWSKDMVNGWFVKSDETIGDKPFTVSGNTITFVPNGTAGTYYVRVCGM